MHTISFEGKAITPSKIVCVGRNYAAHIEELGNDVPDEMVVFFKPNSAITSALHSRVDGEALHYESELAFMVLGGELSAVGFGLDLTRRALQTTLKQQGLPWERAKAFDGSALFSPFVALPQEPQLLGLKLVVDGITRQVGDIGLMIHKPEDILQELKTFITLEDGDIILTGTPEGVGEIEPGQHFEGQVRLQEKLLVAARWTAQ